MFETKPFLSQPMIGQPVFNPGENASGIHAAHIARRALETYRSMLFRGSLGKAWGLLRGRKPGLLDLSAVEKEIRVRNRYHAGVRAVSIRSICGTLGRESDFDASFNPRNENTRDRWLSVARTRLLDIPLPPVELIQVGDRYFVRDGHHRISVARAFGEQAIDAEVTVWQVDGPLPWEKPAGAKVWAPQSA